MQEDSSPMTAGEGVEEKWGCLLQDDQKQCCKWVQFQLAPLSCEWDMKDFFPSYKTKGGREGTTDAKEVAGLNASRSNLDLKWLPPLNHNSGGRGKQSHKLGKGFLGHLHTC